MSFLSLLRCFSLAMLAVLLSAPAFAQLADNTCTGFLSGKRAGVHSKFDGSADAVLWPPNHKLHTVVVSAINQDGDECDVTITDVRQDEDLDGQGDGNTAPDAANCDNSGNESTVDLRGERSGLGTGRYYHVMYEMDDPDSAMPASDESLVLVPHDQGVAHIDTWIDEGPLFASYDTPMLNCAE